MNKFEMYTHTFMGRTVIKSFYKKYVETLDLSNSKKILEFGCGAGCITNYLLQNIDSNTSLSCLDIDKNAIKYLKNKYKQSNHMKFYDKNILEIDFDKDSFDTIIIHYMFHDIERNERQIIMDKFNSIISDKGKIYIREPVKISHGIPSKDIKKLFNESGFVEKNSHMEKSFIGGEMFSALFEKR